MKESLRISSKIYIRSMRFAIPFLAVLSASVFFLFSLNKAINDLEYLKDSLQLGLLGILFFSLSAYELLSLSISVGSEEIISSQGKSYSKLCLAHIAVQFVALVVWSIVMLIFHFARYAFRSGTYLPYYFHIFNSILLYCFLPGIIAILFGCTLSRFTRTLAYTLIFVFTILYSSVLSKLFSWGQIGSVPFARILDWFQITVPNSNWVSDFVYGIGMEPSRWVIVGFWCSLLLTTTIVVVFRVDTPRKRMLSALTTIVAIVCSVFFLLRHDAYIMYKDDRSDGVIYSEYNFRMLEGENISHSDINFCVKKYDLDLDIAGDLRCVATLYLESNNVTTYSLTLYHGYVIDRIEDLDGGLLHFDRQSDYIVVTSDKPLDGIRISYHGNADKYYANTQGIALPGYFAYYPMVGHQDVWDSLSASYYPVINLPESYFEVSVATSMPVYSNLDSNGENCFSGVSSTVTLYAGLMVSEQIENTTYCYSPVSGQSIGLSSERVKSEWSRIKDMLALPLDFSIDEKTVFYQPYTMRAAVGNNESLVVFEDHILLCDLSYSPEAICAKYLMSTIPVKKESKLLWDLFYEYIYAQPDLTVSEKPDYSEVEMLGSVSSLTQLTDEEDIDRYLTAEERFADLMLYQIRTLGEGYVLKSVYEYLISDLPNDGQADFLYNLGGD